MTAKQKYKEFKVVYDAAKATFKEQAGAAFKDIVTEFFNEFPKVNSFGWHQYTPYFNDGDTCTFSVNSYSDSIKINGQSQYDEDEPPIVKLGRRIDKADETCYRCHAKQEPRPEAMSEADREVAAEAASEILQLFDEEILLNLYGDHAEVTVNRDGTVSTEEYEHD